jgi:hypothetical protein
VMALEKILTNQACHVLPAALLTPSVPCDSPMSYTQVPQPIPTFWQN